MVSLRLVLRWSYVSLVSSSFLFSSLFSLYYFVGQTKPKILRLVSSIFPNLLCRVLQPEGAVEAPGKVTPCDLGSCNIGCYHKHREERLQRGYMAYKSLGLYFARKYKFLFPNLY